MDRHIKICYTFFNLISLLKIRRKKKRTRYVLSWNAFRIFYILKSHSDDWKPPSSLRLTLKNLEFRLQVLSLGWNYLFLRSNLWGFFNTGHDPCLFMCFSSRAHTVRHLISQTTHKAHRNELFRMRIPKQAVTCYNNDLDGHFPPARLFVIDCQSKSMEALA